VELSEQDQFFERLDTLREKGEVLQRQNAEALEKLLDLIQVPDPGAVRVQFDEAGLLGVIDIDEEAKEELTPEQLGHEINFSILRASPPIGGYSAAATTAGREIGEVMRKLVGALDTGSLPEPVDVTNDFDTVTVSARWGSILAVSCDPRWLQTTPARLISEEIVRTGRTAALKTDTLGRFPR
jgi:hypothetical protein